MNILNALSSASSSATNVASAVSSTLSSVSGATAATAAATGTTGTAAAGTTASKGSQSSSTAISETQCLTLLTQQLKAQDPLQPMDDTQFLAQMAQFTSLQETDTLNQNMQKMEADNIVGSTVTMSTSSGLVTGQVTGVDSSGSTPNLIVNGQEYPLSSLQLTQQTAAAAASSTSSTTTPASGN